jgi:cytoskeletal protein RodZ
MNYQQSLDAGGKPPSLEPPEEEDEDITDLQSLTEDVGLVSDQNLSLSKSRLSLYRLCKRVMFSTLTRLLFNSSGVGVWWPAVMKFTRGKVSLIRSRLVTGLAFHSLTSLNFLTHLLH